MCLYHACSYLKMQKSSCYPGITKYLCLKCWYKWPAALWSCFILVHEDRFNWGALVVGKAALRRERCVLPILHLTSLKYNPTIDCARGEMEQNKPSSPMPSIRCQEPLGTAFFSIYMYTHTQSIQYKRY